MLIIHETSSAEEKEAFFNAHPSKLYKFRIWEDPFHKKVITDQELYFSSPDKFNDPYHCGLPFKQHADNSDPIKIKYMVEKTAPRHFPHLFGRELEEQCAKQVLLIQQNPESWFEMNWGYRPQDLHKTFGVLSLTPHPENYLMWSHYAKSHNGFCVEFDTRLLVESIAGHFQKVVYSKDIPYFSIMDNLEDELITKLLYTKSDVWSYEDEYRLTKIHKPNSAFQFDPQALTGVYFGCKMSVEHQIEIIDIVQQTYPWVKLYNMNLGKETFGLTIGQTFLLQKH